jgi:hypothetical protein
MGTILNMQSNLPFHLPPSPLAIKLEDGLMEDRRSPYLSMFDPALIAVSRSSPSSMTPQSIVAQQIALQQQLAAARHLVVQHQLATSRSSPISSTYSNLPASLAMSHAASSADTESEDERCHDDRSNDSPSSNSVIVQHTSLDLRKVIKDEENVKHSRSPIKKRPYVPSNVNDGRDESEVVHKHSRLSTDSSSSSRSYASDGRPLSVSNSSPSSSPYTAVPLSSNHMGSNYHVAHSSTRHHIDDVSPRSTSPSNYHRQAVHADYGRVTSPEYQSMVNTEKLKGSQSDHHTAVVAPIIQSRYTPQLSREDEARLTVPLLTYKIHESFYTTFTFLKHRLEEMHYKLRNYQGSESMDGIINRLVLEHMDKSSSFQVSFSLFS